MIDKLPNTHKPERKLNKTISTALVIGFIGLFAYLATLNPSYAATDEYLKEKVYASKQELIETGAYEESIDRVPRFIRNGIVRNSFSHEIYNSGGNVEEWSGSASIVGTYTDADMNVHWIELTSYHTIPDEHYPLKVDQPTHKFTIEDWDCTPLDYLDMDPTKIDPSVPIRDIAICDLNTGLSAEELPSDTRPIDLELFDSPTQTDLQPTNEAIVYGYPSDPSSINWEFQSEIGFTTTLRPAPTIQLDDGLIWYEGDYGPGGSGSTVMVTDEDGNTRIIGLLGAYRGESVLFPLLHVPTGPFPRTYFQGATPFPPNIKEKITKYISLRKNGKLSSYPTPRDQWWQQR